MKIKNAALITIISISIATLLSALYYLFRIRPIQVLPGYIEQRREYVVERRMSLVEINQTINQLNRVGVSKEEDIVSKIKVLVQDELDEVAKGSDFKDGRDATFSQVDQDINNYLQEEQNVLKNVKLHLEGGEGDLIKADLDNIYYLIDKYHTLEDTLSQGKNLLFQQ